MYVTAQILHNLEQLTLSNGSSVIFDMVMGMRKCLWALGNGNRAMAIGMA